MGARPVAQARHPEGKPGRHRQPGPLRYRRRILTFTVKITIIENGSHACPTMRASSGVPARPSLAGVSLLERFEVRKKFFSEEKNQKTFMSSLAQQEP
jgi:hypothetical protein